MVDLTGYKLTFDDEFDSESISQTGTNTTWSDIRPQWRYDANSDIGFGTSSFVDSASGYDPFSVSGGALSITAVPDRTAFGYPGSEESGLISTEGTFSQTYGYFEMRAQTSGAPGSWDAFWMLPDQPAANPNNLPGWQELDVVEHYGANDKGVYSTIHTTDQTPNIPWQDNLQVYSETPGLSTGYHTYGMDWEPDKISFYVDGKLMGSQATPSDMHSPMYMLADLATQSDASGSPMTTKIDYIRAYSKDPSATAVAQGVVSAPDGQDPGLYGATVASGSGTLSASTSTANDGNYTGASGGAGNTTSTNSPTTGPTPGDDSLTGTSGNDTISLAAGNDRYNGQAGADLIYGNQGNDAVYGNQGDDTIFGGQNQDTLYGGQGSDLVYGNTGDDVVYGNLGNDVLYGGQGSDTLYGGQGSDILYGGQGDDVLVGGPGSNTFGFNAGDTDFQSGIGTGDVISDFVSGTDKIDFTQGPAATAQNFGATSTTSTDFASVQATAQGLINGGDAYAFVSDGTDGFLFTTGGNGMAIADAAKLTGASTVASLKATDIVGAVA